jgi:hypothetical protein
MREYRAEDRADAAQAKAIMAMQPRLEAEPDLFAADFRERAINAWIEANWPTKVDGTICRHCNGPDDQTLIPIGYGKRPKIWLHHRCSDMWRGWLRGKAATATGFA